MLLFSIGKGRGTQHTNGIAAFAARKRTLDGTSSVPAGS